MSAGGRPPLVAIDGPGGSGKSTVSQALAARLGVPRLDTGAMYRAVTWLALDRHVPLGDAEAVATLAKSASIELPEDGRVLAEGTDVTAAIRSPEIDASVSQVAANPAVREALVARQQAWIAAHPGSVVEGRDMGSVVAPQADLKIYLTASAEVRAGRRAAEGRGDPAAVGEAMRRRDVLDASRADSPMGVAPGAVVVDSTGRTVEQVVAELLSLLGERPGAPPGTAAAPAPAAPGGHLAGRAIRPWELHFYAGCRFIAVGLSQALWPGPVAGAEHIPASGPFILAPVHRSYLDWLIVARLTRRRLRYLVKQEVWKVPGLGRLVELLGAFPVRRGAADRDALATALAVLEGGEPLVVFPEGTRRAGPAVAEVRDGAAYLALRAGVPIVPVGLAGTEEAMPRGAKLPRPRRVALVVGEAILPPSAARPRGAGEHAHVPRRELKQTTGALVASLQAGLEAAEALRRRGRLPSAAASGGLGAGDGAPGPRR